VRSTSGKALRREVKASFTTAPAAPPEILWTSRTYTDAPPPQFSFSNPPDTVPSAAQQYAIHGGTHDVQSSISMSMFCTKVPLAIGTARILGNVELKMVARKGDHSIRRPVLGYVFVEQNYDTTLLNFQPRVALADVGEFVLRVNKGVKDLTEQYDFEGNRDRQRLRDIYDYLASIRTLSPFISPRDYPPPPDELIPDWPEDRESRGILQENLLALGDNYPDEIDPRVMMIITTRDEPVTEDSLAVEFTRAENLFDSFISTGEVDLTVPGAASAVFTAAAGSVELGDLAPQTSQTISTDVFPLGVGNYRNIVIPQGVTVTFTGTRPLTLKCLSIVVNGIISATGAPGQDASTSGSYSTTIVTFTPHGSVCSSIIF
jgi:hypothetical protein